jgi:serine phosphatase RsbU (regulator of sigma subunit)
MKLNSAVVEAFHLEKYLTGIFMTWNGVSNRITVADMGHSHILVFRNGRAGRFKSLKTNLPIGIEQNIDPVLNQFQLKAGDVVFVYSDGFTEQEDSNGIEFGEKRLQDTIARCLVAGTPIAQVLPAAFDLFRGPVPLQDDASFMALHID